MTLVTTIPAQGGLTPVWALAGPRRTPHVRPAGAVPRQALTGPERSTQANSSRSLAVHRPDNHSVIRFAKLIGMDGRVALASAGFWPEEVPSIDPTAASPVREPIMDDERIRIVTAVSALSRPKRERLNAFLEAILRE